MAGSGALAAEPILIKKNARGDYLRLVLEEYKGHRLLAARVWYETRDGELRPAREGFGLNVSLLPDLIAALKRLEAEAKALSWLKPDGAVVSTQILCAGCGQPFQPRRADQKSCSAACRKAASRKRDEAAESATAPDRSRAAIRDQSVTDSVGQIRPAGRHPAG